MKFDFSCKACGCVEPAVVQASVEGTSVNTFGILDLFEDHEHSAQQAARDDSLKLAQARSALVPCPACHGVDEKVVADMQGQIRTRAIAPTIMATVLIGPVIGAILAFSVMALGVTFPDHEALLDGLMMPVALACIALVAWVAWRVNTKKLMQIFDDELLDLQSDVIFRSGDPERYYEIVESGACSEL